jgi:hypothetical protein
LQASVPHQREVLCRRSPGTDLELSALAEKRKDLIVQFDQMPHNPTGEFTNIKKKAANGKQ